MAEEEAKERMGAIARVRAMLLGEGISFYELEEKASRDEFFESPAKSLARRVMRSEGISVQHLKKGTIYQALENKGNLTKEDIEKHVKAMAALKKAVYDYVGDHQSMAEEIKNYDDNSVETMYVAGGKRIILSEEALKDMEMHRDYLMTKRMKKAAKIEKKKMLKLGQKMMKMRLAERKAHSTPS